MKIFFLVVATTYILYLLFLIVRACSELRNMPYVGKYFWGSSLSSLLSSTQRSKFSNNFSQSFSDLRLKFLTALTFIVLVIR